MKYHSLSVILRKVIHRGDNPAVTGSKLSAHHHVDEKPNHHLASNFFACRRAALPPISCTLAPRNFNSGRCFSPTPSNLEGPWRCIPTPSPGDEGIISSGVMDGQSDQGKRLPQFLTRSLNIVDRSRGRGSRIGSRDDDDDISTQAGVAENQESGIHAPK